MSKSSGSPIVILGLAGIVAYAVLAKPSGTPAESESPVEVQEWLVRNGNDPAALDHKFGSDAQIPCSVQADDFLRSIAKYEYKWDDKASGFLGVRFDQVSTRSAGYGLLTLTTSRALASNGFGAFSPISLYCLYDVQTKQVVRFSQSDPGFQTEEPTEFVEPPKTGPVVIYTPPTPEPSPTPSPEATDEPMPYREAPWVDTREEENVPIETTSRPD